LPSGRIDAATIRDLLHKLIQFELLAEEAQREGLAKDDEVHRQLTKSMLNRYVQHELDQDPRATPDTDAELQAYFDKHKSDYQKPERLRLLIMEFKPTADGANVPPDALKAAADLKAKGDSPAAFGAMARERSIDEQTRMKGGETDWSTREDLTARYGSGVVAVADHPTPQTAGPIRGKDGWFLVRSAGKQEATNPSFEQLKPVIKARALHDKRAAVASAQEDELRRRSPVVIHDDVLAKVDPTKLEDEHEPGMGK
jgi:peptidyl-prolyl cis-trans isomerase C